MEIFSVKLIQSFLINGHLDQQTIRILHLLLLLIWSQMNGQKSKKSFLRVSPDQNSQLGQVQLGTKFRRGPFPASAFRTEIPSYKTFIIWIFICIGICAYHYLPYCQNLKNDPRVRYKRISRKWSSGSKKYLVSR